MAGVILLLGLIFAWLCGQFVYEILKLDYTNETVMLFRAQHLDSGASPIVVIVLSAVALALWASWHIDRIALVDDTTAFEEALLYRREGWEKNALDTARRDLAHEIRGTRRRLSTILPLAPWWPLALVGLSMVIVMAVGVFLHFERSPEAFLFGRNSGAFWQSTGAFSRFDAIQRLAFMSAFGATLWTLWRFIAVWLSLRQTLKRVAASPLITAFERLPRRISRLTRLTIFTEPSRSVVEAVTHTQWVHMGRIVRGNAASFRVVDLLAFQELRRLLGSEKPLLGKEGRKPFTTFASELRRMFLVLERYWRREPGPTEVQSIIAGLKDTKEAGGFSTSGRIRRGFPDAVRIWVRTAEEFAATQVIAYITWVFRYLRRLVQLLLYMLLLMMLLLSAYGFSPESVIRPAFLLLFLITILALLVTITQINKDEVLSRVQRTDPGRVTWDANHLINIGLVIAVPLLGLLSAYAPWFGSGASWIDPIARAFTSR